MQKPGREPQGPYAPQGMPGPQTPVQQPYSGNTGPFEDTGYAPELRAERSENLYRREARFWEHVPDPQQTQHGRPHSPGYFEHPEQFKPSRSHRPPKGRTGARTAAWLGGILLVVLVVGILLWSTVPVVRSIVVEGNDTFTQQEIVEMSGLEVGMNRFSVKPDDVTQRLERNRYLVCEMVHQPDLWTVVIRVKERKPAAAIAYNGLLLYADHRGIVLEEYLDEGVTPPGLVLVKGLHVRRGDLGRTVTLEDRRQLYVYNEILVELRIMGAIDWIVELDMTDMDSIFLETSHGYSVRMGDSSNAHAKLRSMILTVEYLVQNGVAPGTVDVSAPVTPSYIPHQSIF